MLVASPHLVQDDVSLRAAEHPTQSAREGGGVLTTATLPSPSPPGLPLAHMFEDTCVSDPALHVHDLPDYHRSSSYC